MFNLLLINLPCNASDREIREWLESRDIRIKSLHIIRDEVTMSVRANEAPPRPSICSCSRRSGRVFSDL